VEICEGPEARYSGVPRGEGVVHDKDGLEDEKKDYCNWESGGL